MKNKVIWYLFDSDMGAGMRAFYIGDKKTKYTYYSIGLSTCNTTHFKNVDLSQYKETINKLNKLIKSGELKKPDIILASPPCEAGSLAKSPLQAFRYNKETNKFIGDTKDSWLARRDYPDGTPRNAMMKNFKGENILKTQNIGKACIETTKMIIEYYEPKIYLIENGANTYLGKYIKYELKGDIISNIFDYGAYNYPCKKTTAFNGNIKLVGKKETKEQRLKRQQKYTAGKFGNIKQRKGHDNQVHDYLKTYAERSNIPTELLIDIYNQIDNYEN